MIALIVIAVVLLLAILLALPLWLRRRRAEPGDLTADYEALPSARELKREVGNWKELNDPRSW